MTVEIISSSISTKVWDWAQIKLTTPGSSIGLATDCAMGLVCWICYYEHFKEAFAYFDKYENHMCWPI